MDTNDLVPLLELLDDNIDELEESVQPLVKDALTDTASKLPLLDKAQLYILLTYAIESILYCSCKIYEYPNSSTDQKSLLAAQWC